MFEVYYFYIFCGTLLSNLKPYNFIKIYMIEEPKKYRSAEFNF